MSAYLMSPSGGGKGTVKEYQKAQIVGPIPHASYTYTLTFDFSGFGGYKSLTASNFTVAAEIVTGDSDPKVNFASVTSYDASTGTLTVSVQTFRSSYSSRAWAFVTCTCKI